MDTQGAKGPTPSRTPTSTGSAAAVRDDGPADHPAPARVRALPSRLLAMNAMYADRLVGDGLAAEGARKWHFVVLVALAEAGPASQSTLSRRTGVYRSDMVAVVNDLADRGFVERTPDPDDRRRNVVTVTSEGRGYLRRLDAIVDAAQEELLAPLSATERGTLTELLARLMDHHAKVAPPGSAG
ncbi:MarR family transcriptional regulator [Kitasatospora sp. NBC_01246]|uniref:MarR family winged helix-turn-helix transcriptional regulator n=1 Tax=Kitasatospora sp. NBC_01246 TaxID=2903570 RepID=UPI002E30E092|nr:MarR family transcriptional regulator [Kitasatospora sp. NBC_01246]